MTTFIRIIGILILLGGITLFSLSLNPFHLTVIRYAVKLTQYCLQYFHINLGAMLGGIVMVIGGGALALFAKHLSGDR